MFTRACTATFQVDWSSESMSLRWYLGKPFEANNSYSGRFQASLFLQSKGEYGPDGCCPGAGYKTIAQLNAVSSCMHAKCGYYTV